MRRLDNNGLPTYEFESPAFEGLVHAVFTRIGGVSQGPYATLNVGTGIGDDDVAVAENHARIHSHLGFSAGSIASPFQVHSNRIAVVAQSDAGKRFPGTDGLVTNAPGVALLLRFADCQPIVLYDPGLQVVALVHAGWRGVAQAVASRAVETMHDAFGSEPDTLIAGLGPSIGPCCYVVGQEVAAAMGYALPDWNQVMSPEGEAWRFDLPGANAQQLSSAGVRHIEHSRICTSCSSHEFFSHRADKGLTGRFAVVTHLAPPSAPSAASTGSVMPTQREDTETSVTSSTSKALWMTPPGFPRIEGPLGGDE
ncbi:peptidoglycan editing factor PgeF [Chloroflexota bacterium]